MFLIIVIAIIILIILFSKGVFRKEAQCKHCNTSLKGTQQIVLGVETEEFILCKECFGKVHPKFSTYAKKQWRYSDYQDYLNWEEETKEERSQFEPTESYGYSTSLKIDMERGLFSLGSGKNDLILRFCDVVDYDLNFKPEEVKDGVFSTKVKGCEYVTVELVRPALYLEEILNYAASYRVREKGFISKKYEYELSDEFLEIIRAFTICLYVANSETDGQAAEQVQNIDEIQKALALFMFDSMDEVTEETLKKQRNAMIKAFHPDNNENNEAYSQKINAAYDLLSGMVKKG